MSNSLKQTQSTSVRLTPDLHAARKARSFVRSTLGVQAWLDDAVLATSELVTNVVKHSRASDWLDVVVDQRDGRARISVVQQAADVSLEGRSGRGGAGGLGLEIVQRISSRWGVDDARGIWFEVGD